MRVVLSRTPLVQLTQSKTKKKKKKKNHWEEGEMHGETNTQWEQRQEDWKSRTK